MKAMVLGKICNVKENRQPLNLATLPDPEPDEKEILVKVSTCGVCHTELDEIEGRTPPSRLPIVPGHQVVRVVVKTGSRTTRFTTGDRVGIAWIYSTCGKCQFCIEGKENLCVDFKGTGRDANGGYAQYMSVAEDFAHAIPDTFSDSEAAPLLCAGAVGYRSLRLTGMKDGQNLGLTGFGASGHIVITLARYQYPNAKVFVFARSKGEQEFSRGLGAVWAGDTEESPPEKLDCIIDTTPVWKPVIHALKNLKSGGRLVINAIRKEDTDKEYLLEMDYTHHLWMEKEIKSVANVARIDVNNFLKLAADIPLKPEVQEFSYEEANTALIELKEKKIRGAKVLRF